MTVGLAATLAACAQTVAAPKDVLAARTGAERDVDPAPGSPEAKAALALRLAAQARRDEDARAMLVAARMMLGSGTRPARLEGERLTVDAGADPVVTAWAREAIALADGDERLLSEAKALLEARPKGILASSLGTGPLRYVRRIAANQEIALDVRTEPMSAARVAAIGDGDGRIGLNVSSGTISICAVDARTTHSLCAWRAETPEHRVVMSNAGPLASDVMLLSN